MRTSRRPAPARRPLPLALALGLCAAACAREVEVAVVVEAAPLLDRARLDATPTGEAELGKRLTVKVPRVGTKRFWAVKGAEAYVSSDDVAPFPIAGTPAFVRAETLAITGRGGAAVKELRLGSPVRTFTSAALAERQRLAVVEDGLVIGFCDAAGVSADRPPAAVFLQRVHELVRAGDFAAAARFVDAGLAAYPGEPGLAPWSELLRRAADPLAFPPPGQRAPIVPEPALRKGAPAWVAPLAAAVLGAPRADARPLTVLRQNAPVKVVDVGAAFARVELAETAAVAWAPSEGALSRLPTSVPAQYRGPDAAEGEAEAAAPPPALWMRVVDLQAAAATEESLVARARKAQAAGKPDEALELLSRALGLGGAGAGTYEALFDAATAAGDPERAAWAAVVFQGAAPAPLHALRGAAGWSTPRIEEVALVHGCHGPLTPGGALEAAQLPGTPRKPRAGQCVVLTGPMSACERCGLAPEAASAQMDQERAALQRAVGTAGELYPLGPYLRVTVANTSFTAGPPRRPLFVTYGATRWVPILALGAYERVTVYVKVDTYRDVYGVSLGEDDPGEPGEGDGGTFVVEHPDASIVWVGEADAACEECHRGGAADGGDGAEESDGPEDGGD